jgi:hypothetical protein
MPRSSKACDISWPMIAPVVARISADDQPFPKFGGSR